MYALNKPLILKPLFCLNSNLCYWDQLVLNEIEKIVVAPIPFNLEGNRTGNAQNSRSSLNILPPTL